MTKWIWFFSCSVSVKNPIHFKKKRGQTDLFDLLDARRVSATSHQKKTEGNKGERKGNANLHWNEITALSIA
jgi:hypothetical protein